MKVGKKLIKKEKIRKKRKNKRGIKERKKRINERKFKRKKEKNK